MIRSVIYSSRMVSVVVIGYLSAFTV